MYVTSKSKNDIMSDNTQIVTLKCFVMRKLQVKKESIRLTKTVNCAVSQQLMVMKYQMAYFQTRL